MANGVKTYGDLKRKGIYIVKKLLPVQVPNMNISLISGQDMTELPLNSGKTLNFARFERLAKGSTIPEVSNNIGSNVAAGYVEMNSTKYEVTLAKVGSHMVLSTESIKFAEDKVDDQAVFLLGEQYKETMEFIEHNVLKTCPQQFFANKVASESLVDKKISVSDLRRVTSSLNRANAVKISQVTKSSVNFGTEATKDAFFALVHPDLQSDLYNLPGFIGREDYGTQVPLANEIGQHEHIRFLSSTTYDKYTVGGLGVDGTGATVNDGTVEVGTNSKAFVYPVVITARGAFNKVAPNGMGALKVNIGNDGTTLSTPYADTVVIAWTTYHAIAITNENWIACLNVARGEF